MVVPPVVCGCHTALPGAQTGVMGFLPRVAPLSAPAPIALSRPCRRVLPRQHPSQHVAIGQIQRHTVVERSSFPTTWLYTNIAVISRKVALWGDRVTA